MNYVFKFRQSNFLLLHITWGSSQIMLDTDEQF